MIPAELSNQPAVLRTQLQLLDLASDAVVVRDYRSGAIQFWNRGAEDLYGWGREEALGEVAERLLHTQSSQELQDIQAELQRASHWEGELRQTTRTGRRLTVASRWALQRDEQAT